MSLFKIEGGFKILNCISVEINVVHQKFLILIILWGSLDIYKKTTKLLKFLLIMHSLFHY